MDTPVLADQQILFKDTRCHLEDLPRVMADREIKWERERDLWESVPSVRLDEEDFF